MPENRIIVYGFGSSCQKGFDFSEPTGKDWQRHKTSTYIVNTDSPTFCANPQTQVSDGDCSRFEAAK
jgi:hypothetical protein